MSASILSQLRCRLVSRCLGIRTPCSISTRVKRLFEPMEPPSFDAEFPNATIPHPIAASAARSLEAGRCDPGGAPRIIARVRVSLRYLTPPPAHVPPIQLESAKDAASRFCLHGHGPVNGMSLKRMFRSRGSASSVYVAGYCRSATLLRRRGRGDHVDHLLAAVLPPLPLGLGKQFAYGKSEEPAPSTADPSRRVRVTDGRKIRITWQPIGRPRQLATAVIRGDASRSGEGRANSPRAALDDYRARPCDCGRDSCFTRSRHGMRRRAFRSATAAGAPAAPAVVRQRGAVRTPASPEPRRRAGF